MKKINFLAIALIAVLLASCGKTYNVSVEAENKALEGQTAYLYLINPEQMEMPTLVDSAVVKDNKVSFATDKYEAVELPAQAVLSFGKLEDVMGRGKRPGQDFIMFFMEKGNVKITLKEDDKIVIIGTPGNDKFNTLFEMEYANKDKMTQELAEEMNIENAKVIYDIITSNINNNIGKGLVLSGMPLNMLDADQSKKILEMLPEDFKTKSERAGDIIKYLESKVKAKLEAIIDVELSEADGKKSQLSELVKANKVTLIDFWASWCGPCIKEVPHLKAAYDAHKANGFEIIGISVDKEAQAWQDAIKEYDMNWLHFNDTEENGPATQYGVTSIPHTLLVDQEGKVIAMNLRGDQLLKKLEELMK